MFNETNTIEQKNFSDLHKTDSIFMKINVAGLRCAQLKQDAHFRLADDSIKHKNTGIAVEEVNQGLITFSYVEKYVV